ncbi:hypothetical protein Cfor_05456, partial [Coptotermes formosanus]
GHKKIAGNSTTADRFRLLVSDGRHLNSFAMLATQLNDKVTSGELCDYTVIQITRYITSMVANADKGEKRVMVILDINILALGTEIGFKIGNPRPITGGAEAETAGSRQPVPSRSVQPNLFLMDFVKNVPCLHCCVEEQCREWWKSQMTGSLLDRKKI